ncbi:hypothetical protein NM688_g8489 [Phlebia brevispora]|uniref:Uncharacterized protein n=1 Tax=Phlebia brevispora TaxID=194682 RepID=A0ACC1RUG0_9APHY|nr:hypothetical protein NM688_g8489 [Phlebia brevispora]
MASTNSSTSSDALNALEVNLRQLHLEENPSQSRAVTIDGNETVAFGLDTCYMVFPEVVYEEEHVSPRVTPGHYHSGTSLIVEEGYSGAQIIHADNAIDFIISSSIMQDVRDFRPRRAPSSQRA